MNGEKPYDHSDNYFREDDSPKHYDSPLSRRTIKEVISQENSLNSSEDDFRASANKSKELLQRYYSDPAYRESLEGARASTDIREGEKSPLLICEDGIIRSREHAKNTNGVYLPGGSSQRLGYGPKDILSESTPWLHMFSGIEFRSNAQDRYSKELIRYLGGVIPIVVHGEVISDRVLERIEISDKLRERLQSTEAGRLMLSLCTVLPADIISLIELEDDVLLTPKEPTKMKETKPNRNIYFLSMNSGAFAVNPSGVEETNSLTQPYCLRDIVNQYTEQIEKEGGIPGDGWEPRNTAYGTVVMFGNAVLEEVFGNGRSFEDIEEKDRFLNILIGKYIALKERSMVVES